MNSTLWLISLAGFLSLVYGIITYRGLMAQDAGSARMQEISGLVREGAQAYLKRQYITIAIVGVVIFFIALFLLGKFSAIGFAINLGCSIIRQTRLASSSGFSPLAK